MWYFIIFKSFSAVSYVQLVFHLIALLLGNVNLYCFYLIRALLWMLKDSLHLWPYPKIFHNFEVKQYYGVKRHCLRPGNHCRKGWGIGLNVKFFLSQDIEVERFKKHCSFSVNWHFILGPSLGEAAICQSVSVCSCHHLSWNFLKIGSLVFYDIVHDDSWPW